MTHMTIRCIGKTQHKEKLDDAHKKALDALGKKYKLLMVGAGTCQRIFNQLNEFPIDILGNYGMQYAEYREETNKIEIVFVPTENTTMDIKRAMEKSYE